jgi:hypothetical protein
MNFPLILTVVAATAVLWSAFCVGLLEIMAGPERINYPTMRLHVRLAMFAWSVFLAYRGLEMFSLANQSTPVYVTAGALCVSIAMAVAQTALLEHHLRSRLPAQTHKRIQTIMDLARCRRGQVERRGLRVIVR